MVGIDIICFSHIPWEAGNQRPQQLLSRFARFQRVFYIQEPTFYHDLAKMMTGQDELTQVWKIEPRLPFGLSLEDQQAALENLVNRFLTAFSIDDYILWYYTSLALAYTRHLSPRLTLYDCLESADDPLLENELINRANLIVTDGQQVISQLQASPDLVLPGFIEANHFYQARSIQDEPADQAHIPHPRLGFFGVINQLFDVNLLAEVADRQPDWNFVLIGPIVNVEPDFLLRRKNIYYLCTRAYHQLPAYLSSWDAAILPVNCQGSELLITAAQASQCLVAGLPVVSTPVATLVRSYERSGLLSFGDTPDAFIEAIQRALTAGSDRTSWLQKVDAALQDNAWDQAWDWFQGTISQTIQRMGVVRNSQPAQPFVLQRTSLLDYR